MKFSVAAVAAFASAALAALPSSWPKFSLRAEGGAFVVTDGQYLYTGGSETDAILHLTADDSDLSSLYLTYTAANATPTAFQFLYVVQEDVQPVGLTLPHSAELPTGANMTGFSVRDDGVLLQGGEPWFASNGSASSQIMWLGLGHSRYQQLLLYVAEADE